MHGLDMKHVDIKLRQTKKTHTHADLKTTIGSGIMSTDYNVVFFLVISYTRTGK